MKKIMFLFCLLFCAKNSCTLFLCIEGADGAGKTTLGKILTRELDILVVPEPFSRWTQLKANKSLFNEYISNQTRLGYTFELYAVKTFIEELQNAMKLNPEIIITDRSALSSLNVFVKHLYDIGTITALEWELFQEWCHWLFTSFNYNPNGIIYLRTSISECKKRIEIRNRDHLELYIPTDHLDYFESYHDAWLCDNNGVTDLNEVPILVLNGNAPFHTDETEKKKIIDQVKEFVTSIK